MDLVETYVAEGFGLGLSVDVPGKRRVHPELKTLPLPGFAPLVIAALWQGKLPAAARRVSRTRQGPRRRTQPSAYICPQRVIACSISWRNSDTL